VTQTILNETKTLIETSLTLPKDSMEPGLYKATLFSQFTSFTGQPFISDFAYMEFKLPALIPKITNSEGASNPTRTVFVDSIISLDSSRSEDPAVGLTSVSSLPMVRSWKCWTGTITREQVEQLLSSGTPISTATTNCDSLMDSAGKENQTINLPPLPVPSVHMLLLLLLLLMLLLHNSFFTLLLLILLLMLLLLLLQILLLLHILLPTTNYYEFDFCEPTQVLIDSGDNMFFLALQSNKSHTTL